MRTLFRKSAIAAAVSLASCSVNVLAAFDDAGTDYSNAEQRFHLWNEALEPIEMVNSILCFSAQMRAESFVNEGPYAVLADEASCFDEEASEQSGSQSSGSSNQPAYVNGVVNAVREDETSPLVVSVWLPEMEVGEDSEGAVKFKAVISEGASANDPFGQFTFNYEFYQSIDATDAVGGGEVRTIDVADKVGFTVYADEMNFQQSASVVMSEDLSEGIALTETRDSFGGQQQGGAFALAYNPENVVMQKGEDYSSLAYLNGDQSGQCFSRTEVNENVHRYNLYSASTGARVELNSGFPFRYDSNNDGNDDSHGHVGYWGVWTEGNVGLDTGTEITRETFGEEAGDTFTVVSAPGRLIKKSLQFLPLSKAVGVQFDYWDDSAFQAGYNTWVATYMTQASDNVADGFYITHGKSWGEQGEEQVDVADQLISLQANDVLHMWSNQLGGQVQYKEGESTFSFFEEQIMNGSEDGAGELFAGDGSATLYCLDNRCPIGQIGASDVSTWDGPFSAEPASVNDAITYTISNGGANALALVRSSNSEVVAFESGITEQTLQQTPHNWGINTGAMVTADVHATLTNPWDVHDPNLVTSFYVWETGVNSWNRTTAVLNEDGEFQSFDKPIQVVYTHTDANDRSGDAGEFDGQSFMLNYGGNGDLWGLPHEFDESTGYHRTLVNLADGATLGSTNQYVVKALEIEGEMQTLDSTECSELTLSAPDVAVPTSIVGSVDIGSMPVVTGAPAVIAGELQVSE